MSAGELEHEWAGTPGRLIRERYRKAAEMARVCPVLPVLLCPLHITAQVLVCSMHV